jgi:hypothetical protein
LTVFYGTFFYGKVWIISKKRKKTWDENKKGKWDFLDELNDKIQFMDIVLCFKSKNH